MVFWRTEKIGWKWVAIASVASNWRNETTSPSFTSGTRVRATRCRFMCVSQVHRHGGDRPERVAVELTNTKHCPAGRRRPISAGGVDESPGSREECSLLDSRWPSGPACGHLDGGIPVSYT